MYSVLSANSAWSTCFEALITYFYLRALSFQPTSLSTTTSRALVVAKFDLFCSLLNQLALYTLCQYGTPSQVDVRLIALPSCFKHCRHKFFFGFCCEFTYYFASLPLPIEALPSITNSITAPESRPATRSRQLDRRFPVRLSNPWSQAYAVCSTGLSSGPHLIISRTTRRTRITGTTFHTFETKDIQISHHSSEH